MRDFYENFYAAIEQSQAHALFCERVFGRNLGQHGFADMTQLDTLIEVTQLGPNSRVLDLGCGDGRIAEYMSDVTGAQVTGLDYIPAAIAHAQRRTAAKADRLNFIVGDINALDLPSAVFDTIVSIDTIYFSNDYRRTIRQLIDLLRPSGKLAIFFAYGREPWLPVEDFPAEMLPPDCTPLAQALTANGLSFQSWEFTAADYQLALRRMDVLTELRPQFETEGNRFIYENRMGDAEGISQAIEMKLHRRYLYLAKIDERRPTEDERRRTNQ